jgi:hypothetical protein
MKQLRKCLVCKNVWESKKYPFNCPKCKSSNWDFIDNSPCFLCGRIVPFPVIHHIDGNHKNNKKENRLPLCSKCHSALHSVGSKENYILNNYIKKIYKIVGHVKDKMFLKKFEYFRSILEKKPLAINFSEYKKYLNKEEKRQDNIFKKIAELEVKKWKTN